MNGLVAQLGHVELGLEPFLLHVLVAPKLVHMEILSPTLFRGSLTRFFVVLHSSRSCGESNELLGHRPILSCPG